MKWKWQWTWSRQLTRREKLLLQILAVVAAMTFFGVYLYLPLVTESSQLDEQISSLAQTNTKLLAQARQEKEMDGELKGITDQLARLAVQLPTSPEIPQFISQLEVAAKGSNVRVISATLSDLVDQKNHGEITVNLTVSGDYLAVTQFAKRMETLPRATRMSQWRLSGSGAQIELALTTVLFVNSGAAQPSPSPASPGIPESPVGKPNPFDAAVKKQP